MVFNDVQLIGLEMIVILSFMSNSGHIMALSLPTSKSI